MSGVDPYRVWVWVSQIQFWLISVFVIVSFFIILKGMTKLRDLRRSQYFLFLFCIVVGDLLTLMTIIADILSQTLFINLKGPILCKALVFISNAVACFINWSWLVMFLQRFVLLLFPFCRARGGIWRFVYSAKHLLCATFLIAVTTQSWSLILLTERRHITADGQIATICERETELLSPLGYKWVAISEALSTYVCPFLCTLVLDLGVLIWTQHKSRSFSTATEKLLKEGKRSSKTHQDTVRIQSSQSIRSGAKRRQRAIRRCLVMCTIHVLLNAPYYVLQLLDEIYLLSTSEETMIYFVYADALLYLVYLVQFPIVTLYITSLCDDYSNKQETMPVSSVSPMVQRSIRSKRPSSAGQTLLPSTPSHNHNNDQRFDV